MKKFIFLLFFCYGFSLVMAETKTFRISTQALDLVLRVAGDGKLHQCYFGDRLVNAGDAEKLSLGREVYPGAGGKDYFEPALAITHNDGNRSTLLTFDSSETRTVKGGTETIIRLSDKVYPIKVALHYVAYELENVIKTWSEISHTERKPVTLWRYASTMVYFDEPAYYLTEFSGDWAKEVQMSTQQLQFGKKVIDTQLGSRASMFVQPYFELGLNSPASENNGRVMLGTIGWTGNFSFTFEVDQEGGLRVIPGINPYSSDYVLEPKEVFTTPEFIFTLSNDGVGTASRNFHKWARLYQLRDGEGDRLTLLNNWESTGFNFDQAKLGALMHEAKDLGVDMFLLDDGWFANKYPRKDDRAGLGDWDATRSKLPGGVPALVDSARKAGVKFGIWIEPEMLNPKSELFEKHPDWAIHYPNREMYYFRGQLVLDLSNPKVQDFVFGVVEKIMKENPDVAFFKWDCNSPITNVHSPYLKEKQGNLYIDHVRGVYNVMRRVQTAYPKVDMMLCSGGGARCDYEALKYFTEFWASDNTDPVERLFIQWGYSHFMPAKSICAHVTSWNSRTSVKFRTDVASMCKLGFDISLKGLSENDIAYCRTAVENFKRLKPVIFEGAQYRLVSPYDGEHMAVMYTSEDTKKAVLFAYDINPRYGELLRNVKLRGLSPETVYKVEEINLMPGKKANVRSLTGDYLMKVGLPVFSTSHLRSSVYEIIAQ